MDELLSGLIITAMLIVIYVCIRISVYNRTVRSLHNRGMLGKGTITVYADESTLEHDLMCAEYIAKGTDAVIYVVLSGEASDNISYIISEYALKYGNIKII